MGRVASTGNTRQWEGSLRVAEEAMSLLFILAHLLAMPFLSIYV
jgi:hypothetical protein